MSNELEVVEGMQFDRGFLSPYFITDAEKQRVVLEDAYVLVHDKTISSIRDLLPVLEQISRENRPLLLIAEDVTGEALATLVVNAMRGVLKTCAVKAPGFGDRRKAMLEDIADPDRGHGHRRGDRAEARERDARRARPGAPHRGRQGQHDADRQRRRSGKIDARMRRSASRSKKPTSDYDRKQLEERAARLAGGVALIKVGASTETELKEKKSRVEDAVHATRAAVAEGIGPGGGVALLRARAGARRAPGAHAAARTPASRSSGARCEEPLRQIVANAGAEPSVVLERVLAGTGNFGYNAATEEYGDLVGMGVIDPTKVTRLGLQNAASIAGLILTTDCVIVERPKHGVPGNEEMGET